MPEPEAGKVIPVKVALRCRPLIQKEVLEGCQKCLEFVPNEQQVILGSNKAFTYDFVFSPDTPQEEVYHKAVKGLVNGIFKGYNATVLAYGQTGSGKTYSMGGGYGICNDTSEDVLGVIPRVIRDLFDTIEERSSEEEIHVKVSYLEIYKEDLLDLLVPLEKRDKDAVSVREDANGIRLQGLSEFDVNSAEETINCLERGSHGRTVGSTAMNNSSSRSHAIFTIHVDRTSKTDSQDFCKAKFHLVDLAGSERQKKTRAEGERFKEGVNINKGLLALGNVISALGDENQRAKHVPYRDSKLTRLLQDSLGGNSHTVMIACVSPADSNMEETLSTLRYADRARKIKNKPVVNRDPQAAEILRLRQIIQEFQMNGMTSSKPIVASVRSSPGKKLEDQPDYKALKEKIKTLSEENEDLQKQLSEALDANVEQAEKVIRLEIMQEQYQEKLLQLKEVGLQVSGFDVTSVEGQDLAEKTKTLLHDITMKLHEIQAEQSICEEPSMQTSIQEDRANGDGMDTMCEEMQKEHNMRKAKLTQDLNNLNKMLGMKEDLVNKMKASDKNMEEIKAEYEKNMKDLEVEVGKLAREKEELEQQLHSVKANEAKNKIAEQRRKRVKELETQMADLKKKMTEQSKMLKLKEQADKQLQRYSGEIQQMKSARVKLVKQIKEDAEEFRRFRQQKDKEVMQLKAKERKRQADMAKLERQVLTQRAVARRKAEEASNAQKRLKEALMKQKQVQEDRAKRQEASDGSAYGSRIKKWISEEVAMAVAVEEARAHLEQLTANRKDLTEQLQKEKEKFDDSGPSAKRKLLNNSKSQDFDEFTKSTQKKMKELETEIELTNAQIQGLNEKLAESTDNATRQQGIIQQVHSLSEGRTAIRILLTKLVNTHVDKSKKKMEVDDIAAQLAESEKIVHSYDEEIKKMKESYEDELLEVKQEYENKVLYLMSQLNNKQPADAANHSIDDKLRERLRFQEKEISRLGEMQERLDAKTKELERLKKELTALTYKQKLFGGSVTSTDAEFSFFSPALTDRSKSVLNFEPSATVTKKPAKLLRKPKKVVETDDDTDDLLTEDSDDDIKDDAEVDTDDEWVSGKTPSGFQKYKSVIKRHATNIMPVLRDIMSDDSPATVGDEAAETCCSCRTNCTSKRCSCVKAAARCRDDCRCQMAKCQNREQPLPDSTEDESVETTAQSANSSQNELNTTFNITASVAESDTTFKRPSLDSTVLSINKNKNNEPSEVSKSKRSTDNPKIRKSSENRTPEKEELAGAGIMKKKRKIGGNPSTYFPNLQ